MSGLKVLFIYANSMMENLIPVGASSILGALRSPDIEVKLFDTTFYKSGDMDQDDARADNLQVVPFDYGDEGIRLKDDNVTDAFLSVYGQFKPDVIFLSVVEPTFRQGVRLLRSIKGKRPFSIAGGVFAILSPDKVIACESIDGVCIGEGEDACLEFARRFREGKDIFSIPGMWFKKDGKVIRNPIKRLVDLDHAALMDFSLFEHERFYKPMQGRMFRMVPLEFSRGCPYKCSYCANHAVERRFRSAGKWYRWKSMDRIFSEIKAYKDAYDINFFYFVSETFLSMDKNKFNEFCERYSRIKVPFWFNTRPETITKEKLDMLEKIHCFRMGIGLEHGNEEFRKRMLNRNVSNEKIVSACKLVEGSSITYSINNMIGFPGETRDLVFDTINLNRKINADTVGTFIFTPFKGTDLYDYCLDAGYIKEDSPVGDLNRDSVLQNNTLSQDEIKGLLRAFPLYTHFDESMFPLIRRAEAFTEEGNRIFNDLASRYRRERFSQDQRIGRDQAAWSQENVIQYYALNRNRMEDLYESEKRYLCEYAGQAGAVLDIGCAEGGFFGILSQLNKDIAYTGVDISKNMISSARKTYKNAAFKLIDGEHLDFPDDSFDLTICFGVLHMTESWRQLLKEAWRVTGKRLIFDLRIVQDGGISDRDRSYQRLEFEGKWDGVSKVPYIILNNNEAFKYISAMLPQPGISTFGYWHPVSKSTVSTYSEVCMAVYCLEKTDKVKDIDWNIPIARPELEYGEVKR